MYNPPPHIPFINPPQVTTCQWEEVQSDFLVGVNNVFDLDIQLIGSEDDATISLPAISASGGWGLPRDEALQQLVGASKPASACIKRLYLKQRCRRECVLSPGNFITHQEEDRYQLYKTLDGTLKVGGLGVVYCDVPLSMQQEAKTPPLGTDICATGSRTKPDPIVPFVPNQSNSYGMNIANFGNCP